MARPKRYAEVLTKLVSPKNVLLVKIGKNNTLSLASFNLPGVKLVAAASRQRFTVCRKPQTSAGYEDRGSAELEAIVWL